jgi:trimeric autotransporter adhesin
MSIKQNGGVFGRNPTFNDVTIEGDLIINGEVFTGLDFQGSWNANTNSPTLASSVGTNGEFYIVSIAGATDLNGITNWGIGDWAIFNGTAWQRVEGGADGNFNDVTVAGNLGVAGDYSSTTLGTSNLRLGVNAGDSIVSGGNWNTVVGDEAGTAITTGTYNTGVGYRALWSNVTGATNAAFGVQALAYNTTGASNTAVGTNALFTNTTGTQNVAVGTNALDANTTASNNTALGYNALLVNTTGASNTAVGALALDANTTGLENVAMGHHAMSVNTTGKQNVAIGQASLDANTTADNNTAVGHDSLTNNTTGASNTGLGQASLQSNTTASNNTAVGYSALSANTTGANNVALGYAALYDNTEGANNVAVGYLCAENITTGTVNTIIGNATAGSLTTGSSNTIVGHACNVSAGDAQTAMGLGYALACAAGYTTLGSGALDIRAAHGNVTWATVSDERYKKDIVDSTAGLSFINALQPRTFKYKTLGELPETFRAYEADSTEVFKNSETNHGFIAQEIKAAIDADDSIKDGFKLWDDREDGSQEVAEAALIPILVKAIQELSTQLDAALARITTLEG